MQINLGDYAVPLMALIGTLFGGAGLEFIRRWLGKAKEKDDTATALRQELRTELTAMKVEQAALEKELDEWKQKYYDVVEKYLTIKIQYENAVALLREKKIEEPKEVVIPPVKNPLDTGLEPGV